jgi:hypothetical protein
MITLKRRTRPFLSVLLVAATITVILFFLAVMFTVPKAHMQGESVWCFDVTADAKGGRHTFGHPPGIKASAVAASMGGTAVEQHCFDSWADAASYITGGQVTLSDDASEEDYVRETDRFFRTGVTPLSAP